MGAEPHEPFTRPDGQTTGKPIGARDVLGISVPIIVAGASTPLLGLVDVAVIGHRGSTAALGAIALGSLIFNFVYWTFGFLRMSTTGFVAQADGAGDENEVRATGLRAILLGLVLGLALFLLQGLLSKVALEVLPASPEVESLTRDYFSARIGGAPAALPTFALMGILLGLARTRLLLLVQVLLNATNVLLDLLFAGVLGWGARGVGLGTAIAEWVGFLVAVVCVHRLLLGRASRHAGPLVDWPRLRDPGRLRTILSANVDIMGRTLLLLAGFGWFTSQGARFGDAALAANHVLLQLISFCAFFLDGYAFAAEVLVGRAKGAGDLRAFDTAVLRTSELALVSALSLGMGLGLGGPALIHALTDLPDVRRVARAQLPALVTYVLTSVAAFQLDGIFLGITRTRALLGAAAISLACFVLLSVSLTPRLGNTGLWYAFVGYVIARGVGLAAYFPQLRRALQCSPALGVSAASQKTSNGYTPSE